MYQGIRISGFGGQGVVSAGMLLAQAGLFEGKGASWYPAYGAEMRGGTANCSVVISDGQVNTPVVSRPDTCIVLNEPSLAKFEPLVRPGGLLIVNSSLVNSKPARTDITIVSIPCNEIAEKTGSARAANLVALGAFVAATGAVSIDAIVKAMSKVYRRATPEMIELNKKALQAGADYK
ncbi:2-oxoglutarate ferredoxin oxidoreductase subunit gamma [Parelusimicrobium proximum]|uniref:2-oxoacid:acceptor oxidoreductase family protein n=1 Tax=Parelusimicrobium proximum TaxID=3228953 RepID=UPI003D1678B8